MDGPSAPAAVRKRFVRVDGRLVHYRTAGSGPPVVLLHDSPRSSALHRPLIDALSDAFTVIAFDTPGYGHSDPLRGGPLEMGDFSAALAAALDALGVGRAGFYSFHTSSKIVLDLGVRFPERVSVAILDGLSLPEGGPDPVYIERYMRPFEIDEEGAYIAREWTRLRDSGRWFPWFDRRPATRIVGSASDPVQAHQSLIDYFEAGPHYADAYRAAMFYVAAERLPLLRVPTVVMAREDDVLYAHVDRLPQPLPAGVTMERLGPDRGVWRTRVQAILTAYAGEGQLASSGLGASGIASGYLDLPHGRLRVRSYGTGPRRTIVYLHETPGGAGADEARLRALGDGRTVIAPDLPGCGQSDPLTTPSADAYAEVVEALIRAAGEDAVDLVAEGTATPLALRVMARSPALIGRAVLDGVLLAERSERAELRANYCPPLAYETSGGHLHRVWHMLRDQDIQWPWYEAGRAAVRRNAERRDEHRLHRRMLDVLAQLDHYGDAVAAALQSDARADLAAARSPTLVLESDDPRDRWAGDAAQLSKLARAEPRAQDRVRQVLAFLDRP